jgi:hypothetical protein
MNPYTMEYAAYAKQEELIREATSAEALGVVSRPSAPVRWLRALLAALRPAPRSTALQAEREAHRGG